MSMRREPRPRSTHGCAIALCFAAFLALLISAPFAFATAGEVDPSFGTAGIVATELGPHYERTSFTAIASQEDGGFLATRETSSAPPGRSRLIRRYGANGSLDPSFMPQPVPAPRAEAVDENGKVLRAAAVEYGSGESDRLERLDPGGTPDTTFGANGKSDRVPFAIEKIIPLPSGEILVAGAETYEYTSGTMTPIRQVSLARLSAEGKLETGYGTAGIVKLHAAFGLTGVLLRGIAVRPGEGALLFLDSSEEGGPAFLLALTASGGLDTSYGTAGKVELDGSIIGFNALGEGDVLVAGEKWGPRLAGGVGYESELFLARYTASGQPDPSFAGGVGSATADFGGVDLAHTVLWEGDGSALIGGSAISLSASCLHFGLCEETPVLARFGPDGRLDAGFGAGGLLKLDALTGPGALRLGQGILTFVPRAGGGVLAGGGSGIAAFIAAIGPGGALDPGFGEAGIITENEPTQGTYLAGALASDRKGSILLAGRTTAGTPDIVPGGVVVRYLPDGRLDPSFGNGDGYVRVPGWGEAIAPAPDGGSFVLSGGESTPSITRITPSGEIDSAFGEEGTVLLDPQRELHSDLRSLAVFPGGGVIAVGQTWGPRMVIYRLGARGRPDHSFGRRGALVLGFGKKRPCGVRQVAVQPNGRILLAGYVGHRMALARLLPSGALDRSFGHRGLAIPPLGKRGEATAVATQGTKILLAGWARPAGGTRELLLRYTQAGHLDRSFAKAGISRVSAASPGGAGSLDETTEILPSRRRIVIVRDGPGRPVLGFTRDGRFEPHFAAGGDIAPGRSPTPNVFPGPFGTLQHGKVVLAWSKTLDPGVTVELQRLTSR